MIVVQTTVQLLEDIAAVVVTEGEQAIPDETFENEEQNKKQIEEITKQQNGDRPRQPNGESVSDDKKPTMRSKASKCRKMTDEEILNSLSKYFFVDLVLHCPY